MTQFFSRNWSTGTPEKVTAGAELVRSKIPSDGASDGPFSPKLDRPVTRFQRLRLWSINAKGLIIDEGVAVAGVPRCGDRDPSAGVRPMNAVSAVGAPLQSKIARLR